MTFVLVTTKIPVGFEASPYEEARLDAIVSWLLLLFLCRCAQKTPFSIKQAISLPSFSSIMLQKDVIKKRL